MFVYIMESLSLSVVPGIMVNFAAMVREHWVNVLVPLGFVIGIYMDRWNDQKLTAFRNKSALYSRWVSNRQRYRAAVVQPG